MPIYPNQLENRKKTDGSPGYKPGSNKYWTKKRIISVFKKIIEYLKENEDIILLGELSTKLEFAGILKTNQIEYLFYDAQKQKEYDHEIKVQLKKVNRILEYRIVKTKEIYPGIASLSLKNKHKWTDKTEVEQTGEVKQTVINITCDKEGKTKYESAE